MSDPIDPDASANVDATAQPPVVDRAAFEVRLEKLRTREKAHTREGDAIAAARRQLPMVEVPADLPLTGPAGPTTLLTAFEGRAQLIAYYFMWHEGHPAAEQCEGCTYYTTQVRELSHFHARDITFAVLCQGTYDDSVRYRDFMGWDLPWYSAQPSLDQLLVGREIGLFHLVCYLRDGDRVFETYWTKRRGVQAMDYSYALMDLTAYGRQEAWEDSPAGWPRRGHASRTDGGAPDWPPIAEWPSGRPTSQWPRLDAGQSDALSTPPEHRDLRAARLVGADLTDAVMRATEIHNTEIESPWLFEGDGALLVNGVDVIPLVDAELNRRFPGRADRRAEDPAGLRAAWAALENVWTATLERVDAMPAGTVDVSWAGEWSFAQTLRHLVMATDTWLGRAVLQLEAPYHPLGLAHKEAEADGLDMSMFTTEPPSYADVLDARANRVALVRDFIATVTRDELSMQQQNPWAPEHSETTLSCLHTILEEEWEHHRYAVRDLDAIEGR